jgi:hypothetical protein
MGGKLIFGSATKWEKMPLANVKASYVDDTDRYIYLRSRIITCDEANGNGDFLSKEEVLKKKPDGRETWKTFIGTMVDYNHDTSVEMGKTIDANFVDSKGDEKAYVEIICKIDKQAPKNFNAAQKKLYEGLISRIEAGDLDKMSMEAYAENARCNYCKAVFPFAEPCEHIRDSMNAKIKAADGTEFHVCREDMDVTFVGSGIVENPADKKAEFENLLANEKVESAERELEMGKRYTKEELKKMGFRLTSDEDYFSEKKGNIDYYFKKHGDRFEYDGSGAQMSGKKKSTAEALSEITGLDLLKIIDALDHGDDRVMTIVSELEKDIIDPIFEGEFKVDKRLTMLEINKIKAKLIESGKMISKDFGAHLIILNGKEAWLITKNGLPEMTITLDKIWGEDLKTSEEIDGMTVEGYAKSELFKRRMLMAYQKDGKSYLESIWNPKSEDIKSKSVEDVFGLEAKDYKSLWQSYGSEFDKCVSKAKGWAETPEAYCADLEKKATGKWPREKASLIEASKDDFKACLMANKENKDIKATEGQTQDEAIEAHCFKQVLGIKASYRPRLKDIFDADIPLTDTIVGGDVNAFKAWLNYKMTGKFPTLTADKIRIKLFAKSLSTLNEEDKDALVKSSNLMKFGFTIDDVRKYHILASEDDIKKLQKYDMSINDMRSLFNSRFGFEGDK